MFDFEKAARLVRTCEKNRVEGTVTKVGELSLEAALPGARLGDGVIIESAGAGTIQAEVIKCHGDSSVLVPLGSTSGLGAGDTAYLDPGGQTIPCGEALLGRIVSPSGDPLDGEPLGEDLEPWPLRRDPPDPMARLPVRHPLETGVKTIDGCLTIGRGQRIGLFAGPGAGKTTLLGTLARQAQVDVSVICLVGERGREVGEFLDLVRRGDGLSRSIVVLAGAQAPPMVRARALETATAIAEYFRSRNENVLLLVDSLTRTLMAKRDIALALGEPPARGGYPASTFSSLPTLLERAGNDEKGSITAVYAVLTHEGEDPVAHEAKALLDGHISLCSKLGNAGRWPAVDVVSSISRVMSNVTGEEHATAAATLRRLLGAYAENADLILMGAYRKGSCKDTDAYLDLESRIEAFLRQPARETSSWNTTLKELIALTEPLSRSSLR